jgi:hypothetical protein
MPGPSIFFLGVPLALGYSIHALRGATQRTLALTALKVSGAQAVWIGSLLLLAAVLHLRG